MGEPETGGVDAFMRESDAFSWYMERDPILRSTIVAIAWLEHSPDMQVVLDRLERASQAIPLFRMRLAEPPARIASPRWSPDPDFDLAWHVRRMDAPAPRTAAAVMDVARRAATTAFDPAHPLWEFTLVDHLEDGRAAFVMKLHHALTDGIGGMKLALHLFDLQPVPAATEPLPVPAPRAPGRQPGLVGDSLRHDAARLAALARHEAVAVGPAVIRAARHPRQTLADVVATARSIGRTVAPVATTLSPVMTGRSLGRRLEMVTVGLDDLKRAASAADGTLNDGFMAGLTGGLRRYHEQHGAIVRELRVTLPISIRTPSDPVAGNRITLQRFTVPVDIRDPAARIQAVGARCRAARAEPSLPHTNAIAGALNLLPPGVVGGMLKHVDFLASNVPGFTSPVYLGGARLLGYFPFGPTIGAAFNATLLSYDGTCCIGLTIDTAAVPDVPLLLRCLGEGFAEVLDLGGEHGMVSFPLHEGAPAP